MVDVFRDAALDDDSRRQRIYAGDLFLYSPRASSRALCDFAGAMIEEAFAPHDPRTIHHHLSAEQTSAILSKLKPAIIHHPRSKELIPEILASVGCDLDLVYFDVPRVRSAYPSDYLTSGIAYAFHPHRDTWYSAPQCQINWWLPIYPITPENGLAFYPKYFDRPIANNSEVYNYYRWNGASRRAAGQHIHSDTRVQPKPQEPVSGPAIKPLPEAGGMILFSAAQLHATVENTSGIARYSLDFRTVHRNDAKKRGGVANVDSRCTGSAIRDFLRACDLARLPADVIDEYNDGTELSEGPLIYSA